MTTTHRTIAAKEQTEKNHRVEDCDHRLRSPKKTPVSAPVNNFFLKTGKSKMNVQPFHNTLSSINKPFVEKVGVPLFAMGPIAEKNKQEPILKLGITRGYC